MASSLLLRIYCRFSVYFRHISLFFYSLIFLLVEIEQNTTTATISSIVVLTPVNHHRQHHRCLFKCRFFLLPSLSLSFGLSRCGWCRKMSTQKKREFLILNFITFWTRTPSTSWAKSIREARRMSRNRRSKLKRINQKITLKMRCFLNKIIRFEETTISPTLSVFPCCSCYAWWMSSNLFNNWLPWMSFPSIIIPFSSKSLAMTVVKRREIAR